MNKLSYLLLAVLVTVVVSCKNETTPEVKTVQVESISKENALNPNATYAKAEFGIEGMTCAVGCAKTIEKKLAKMDGVKSAKVDFDRRLAMVEYDNELVTPIHLTETVTKVADAYTVNNMKTVEAFSKEKKACTEDCKKACCTDKKAEDKMTCKTDCKKDCCKDKQKA